MEIDDPDLPCVVEIRRNADGVVRQDRSHRFYGDFVWSDGNYACDCNRSLFFYRCVDEEEKARDRMCGDTDFSVRVLDIDGKVLYEDDGWKKSE